MDNNEKTARKTLTKREVAVCQHICENAEKFLERSEPEKTIMALRKIPEEFPEIANVYSLMGVSYAMMDRVDDARICFEKGAEAEPGGWQHWISLASLNLESVDLLNAKKCMDKVYEVGYPSEIEDQVDELRGQITEIIELVLAEKPYLDVDTYIALEERLYAGVACMKEREWSRAIQEFEYVVSVDSRSEEAYECIGLVHLFKGEIDEAEKCFNKALEINPEYPPAVANLRILDGIRGELAENSEYMKGLEDRIMGARF